MQSWNSSRILPLLTRQQVCSTAPDGTLSIRAGITNPDTLEKILDQIYLSAKQHELRKDGATDTHTPADEANYQSSQEWIDRWL